MARIRSIKPDFWTDGAIVRLSPSARLLYIGMWNFALCDHGHVADDTMKLKLQILPMDDVNVDDLLKEIMDEGRVVRLTADDGRTYLHVKRFEDHQKIDPRWRSRCPACALQDSLTPTETPASLPEPQRDSPELGLGKERKGKEKDIPQTAAQSGHFDSFWADYPRKIGKGDAVKAYNKALKATTPERIREGVENLRIAVAGKDPQFTPYPASWLNAGRWDDEPEQQPNSRSPWSKEFHQ